MTRYSVPMEALPQVSLNHGLATDPIGVMISSSGQEQVFPGDSLELSITVKNKGDKGAVIDIFLDELPVAIQPWSEATQTHLALDPDQGEDVTFRFDIPVTALPGTYHYWLVVDSPNHYPDSIPQRSEHILKVLPPPQAVLRENDPTFAVEPVTTHTKPIKTLPGNPLQFQVYVYNRSDRVDSFCLDCTDLPEEWVTITYPQGFRAPGLAIVETELELNPDMEGVILLTLTPPLDALSQTMLVSLQLNSKSNPDLKLLDVLYIHIQPVYQITMRFRTLVSRIQSQPGIYSIQASNQGNTNRTLDLQIVGLEGSDLCNYEIRPDSLTLAPQQTLISEVTVQPKHPWQRPLFGGGRLIQFEVVATDPVKNPLPENPMQGLLTWEARPWWQILPFIWLFVGSFLGLLWLAWWLFLFPRPPATVLRFAPESPAYEASQGDTVFVGFKISNPRRIQQLEIIGQSVEGARLSGPLTFDLSKEELPPELEPVCIERRQHLTCRNVRTDAKRAGEYQFILKVIPKPGRNAIPTQAETSLISIAPIPPRPLPSILELAFSETSYLESSEAPSGHDNLCSSPPETEPQNNHEVCLNWSISHPEQLSAIQLVVRDAEQAIVARSAKYEFKEVPEDPNKLEEIIPEKLGSTADCSIDKEQILECSKVPTGLRQAGTYTIDVIVTPREQSLEQSIIATSDPIEVHPRPPEILSLKYEGAQLISSTSESPEYSGKFFVAVDNEPSREVSLEWEVKDNPGTQVMLLPAPGHVKPKGSLSIPLRFDSGEVFLTLQVTNSVGEMQTRSLSITPYDPTPEKPPEIVANTGNSEQSAGAAGSNGESNGEGNPESSVQGPPVTSKPGQVSPVELPPLPALLE
ncbi:hypothetical protein S7335_638 [Synechococcus sp. PCC 7335]|uniref:COG1470 family protein n=1 Tax=Synechococcus sp. (strain ATCC 29403 / PCC 7335) TaxID=91464 RepID=UPI00017ED2C8|nr:hypothetical protein [Synechococcus sp. PCC 7335]EDX83458.1 hypothetical protein S7335_638 [Synechococcus sp. PCC 7335]